ncbi:MAG: aldehyde dehydrogenase family protein [Rhodococcus sp. (in: high G+C Gram-positive bacteria)]|uniref:aldehyde dehydrogenase family protein n=1 Tax=Rhodococcus sp. TaxID=1831 RepID=UPI002ADC63B4|nr:aldehyde dehydrogenase family protein [Rhodococcus sp. (in: high G+C Gram-positive bacteria)]
MAISSVRDYRLLIDGKLVPAQSGSTAEVIDPATEEVLATVPSAGAEDVRAAVDAADRAFVSWRETSIQDRAAMVLRLADLIDEHRDELGELESRDTGSCIGPMTLDVDKAAGTYRYFAGLAPELKGMTVPASTRGLHYTVRVPYGVVAGIAAFNHPLMFAAAKTAAPLIAGNTVVLKPPPQAPLTTLVLGELAASVFPPGVFNIVSGEGSEVGQELVADPRVRRISLTGSIPTGKAVMRSAAEHLADVSLELGGKNPLLVFPDADLDAATTGAIKSMNFGWQGQSCGSTSRVLVHESLHDEFCRVLVEKVRAMRIGSPQDPSTEIGALISQAQYDRVLGAISDAVEDGAVLLTGGQRPADQPRGFYVEPTVFDGVTEKMRIFSYEIFGPVLSIMTWSDEDEAVRLANATDFGLTANLYTNDLPTALRVIPRIDAGFVWVNGQGEHFLGLPYGGVKQSGIGSEESLEQLLSFTQTKSVSLLTLPFR